MLPIIALVGRPNVGKSTLFNQLTHSRDALVADFSGLTRDRKYGEGLFEEKPYIVIDTGGLSSKDEGLDALMAKQSLAAITEADEVLFLVDARAGLTVEDKHIAEILRKSQKNITLVVNKTDGLDENTAIVEFYELGFSNVYPISASHKRGLIHLMQEILQAHPAESEEKTESIADGLKLAIIGRPNVGKSTLINRIIGEERLVALDLPGTTRDSIAVPFEYHGEKLTLIDTAGIRRKGKVFEAVEKFSIVKALKALEMANVCLILLDAREGVTEQDMHLIGFAINAGKAIVIAVNKWDGLSAEQRQQVKQGLERRLVFADFAKMHFISALHGSGVGDLLPMVYKAYASSCKSISTSELNRAFAEIVAKHQPPSVHGRRIKLRYAHIGGHNPPLFIIHGNQTESLPESYKRYLINAFRAYFKLSGTAIKLQFKSSDNPYKDKKNVKTARQLKKRQRLMRYYKKKKS